jgi:thiosulfate/3-mercaptopyruvate sulfurtransferase
LNDHVSPLITVAELAERFDSLPRFDMRWSLTDPDHGRAAYEQGHVPGAVFVDLDRDLAASEGDGRHPLPRIDEFVAVLGRLGIVRDQELVVYDDMAGAVAARMWWMLESIGHRGARVLDGGLRAWVDAGYPLQTGPIEPLPATYPPVDRYRGVVRYDGLDGRVVADVRAPERYRGDTEPVDPKSGHIPGAINYPLAENLVDGRFRDSEALAKLYRDFPDNGVVSCGSGVNACHAALALIVAGRPMPDLYVGSFSDWSRRDLPVHTGPKP